MFKHLRSKLTVLYVALFVTALGAIAVAVYAAADHHAEQIGSGQLATSGTVFENLLATRNRGLQAEADILAHDYGFRAAVATGEAATLRSALDNLASRLGITLAFVVDADGRVAAQAGVGAALPPDVVQAVQGDDPVSGIFRLNGVAYETVAAPIRTPAPAGWVVFATALGHKDMAQLERLSAIPLQAAVLGRQADGRWISLDAERPVPLDPALQALAAGSAAHAKGQPRRIGSGRDAALALARPLEALGNRQHVVLLLRYPMADALQPFRALFVNILVIGLAGVLLLVVGSWVIARNLTRPISALEDAARRLQRGEAASVTFGTGDEIARLGATFNAMAQDIREREASLEQARDLAEAADRAKSEFLANMNHEVRTPLNGVLGVASVLAGTELDARQRRMLELIQASGEGLQHILNAVLDMIELGTEHVVLNDAAFDLGGRLRQAAAAVCGSALAKGLTVDLAIAPGADRWVCGDAGRLDKVLANLLGNAVKFTERGHVALSADCDVTQKTYRIEVRDTGIGFDPGRSEEMFQPFSQADGSMTRQFGGTGLGLSLARETARAMGGEITADGAPGFGACFTLVLPLAPAEPALAPEEDPSEPAAAPDRAPAPASAAAAAAGADAQDADRAHDATHASAPLRVLMAEDHPANRIVVELILDAVGIDLVSVENGAEAVATFKDQAFDLVLMDLQMPIMDGITAIRLIREHEGARAAVRTPIVVLSANVQQEHMRAAAAAGADRHLAKPLVAPVLIAALEEALEAHAQDVHDAQVRDAQLHAA